MDFSSLQPPLPQSHFPKRNKRTSQNRDRSTNVISKQVLQSVLSAPSVSLNPPLWKFWSPHCFSLKDTIRGNLEGSAPRPCDTSLTPCNKESSLWDLDIFSRKVNYVYLLIATYAAQKPHIYLTCFIKDTRCSCSKFQVSHPLTTESKGKTDLQVNVSRDFVSLCEWNLFSETLASRGWELPISTSSSVNHRFFTYLLFPVTPFPAACPPLRPYVALLSTPLTLPEPGVIESYYNLEVYCLYIC